MTVCIAALANFDRDHPESSAIVCVADKMVSWGDIQWDTDETKILELERGRGPVVLTAGTEDSISRIIPALTGLDTASIASVTQRLEEVYSRCFDDLVQKKILSRMLMTRDQYVSAISGGAINPFVRSMARKVSKYDMGCDLLVCGFTDAGSPFIVNTTSPGIATDLTLTGFQIVGLGADRALPRMWFSGYEKKYTVDHVLYTVFDAKVSAEMNVSVGMDWDAAIIFPGRVVHLGEEEKKLIDRAWYDNSYSPYEKREPDDPPKPPADWKKRLRRYVESVSKPQGRGKRRT